MALDDASRTMLAAEINAINPHTAKFLVASGLPMGYNSSSVGIEQVFQKDPPSKKRAYSTTDDSSNDSNNNRKKARVDETPINKATINKAVELMGEEYVRKAIRMLLNVTMHGGAAVTICSMLNYPGYTPTVQTQLLEELERALKWYIAVGFVPFKVNKMTPLKRWEESKRRFDTLGLYSDSDDDWLDDSMDEHAEPPAPLPFPLYGSDLLFQVPPLGKGDFTSYFHTPTNRIKIDFIKTWKDLDDPDNGDRMDVELNSAGDGSAISAASSTHSQNWFVYTREEPVGGEPQSSIASLIANYEAFMRFKSQDKDANYLATHPIPVTQERPPQKMDTKNFSLGNAINYQQMAQPGSYLPDNFNSPKGFPSSRGTKQSNAKPMVKPKSQQQNTDPESEVQREILNVHQYQYQLAALFQNHSVEMPDGRVFAGLVTPHAYPSITQRESDYIQQVSVALMVPIHILLSRNPSTSASFTGASANGGKKQSNATGAKQAKSAAAQQNKSSNGSGYSADPIFIPALEYRKFLQDFFSCVMEQTHGFWPINEYINSEMRLKNDEMKMRASLIKDLEERIETSRKDIEVFTPPPPPEPAKEPSADSPGPSASASSKNDDAMVTGPEEYKVPSAEAVAELTKRRAEINGDMQQLRNAIADLEKLNTIERSITLTWRLPFITDTGNPMQIIEALGGTREEGIAIARSRLGLAENNF